MRLIVTGGGSGKDTKKIDELFASILDKNKPLLYVPVALDSKKYPYLGCLSWLKNTFEDLGVSNYEILTEDNVSELISKNPEDYAGIYIGGGNTPYLLNFIKESGFSEFLKKSLEFNIPVYGGSAGAIIFARTILPSLVYDKSESQTEDFYGLNILNNMDITCHYSEGEKEKISHLVKENDIHLLIALTEKNALFLDGGNIKLIGSAPAYLFKNNEIKEISTESIINF